MHIHSHMYANIRTHIHTDTYIIIQEVFVVKQQFYVGPDHFVARDVFSVSFWWIYCYN